METVDFGLLDTDTADRESERRNGLAWDTERLRASVSYSIHDYWSRSGLYPASSINWSSENAPVDISSLSSSAAALAVSVW